MRERGSCLIYRSGIAQLVHKKTAKGGKNINPKKTPDGEIEVRPQKTNTRQWCVNEGSRLGGMMINMNMVKQDYRHVASGGGVLGVTSPGERALLRSSAIASIFRTLSSRTGFVRM